MKVVNENNQITFKCVNHHEYFNLLSALNGLVICCCNKYNGTCKRCFLSRIFDDNDIDLCDIITDSYFAER